MQELRLVGVDGEHLRLSSEQGVTFRLPIDDALRTATAGESAGGTILAAGQDTATDAAGTSAAPPARKPAKPPVPLTPRDIQARIRSGATAEQVASDGGVDLQHVLRYEGPVRAEREYIAYLAQRVEVASPLPSHDGYRSAFGDEPARLGDMVAYRVRSYGIDPATLEWDSWRRPDGAWHVVASFELPEDSRVDLGEQPPAWWTYNPTRKNVANGNRWAQVLSELEPLDGPLPSRRLSAVADRVFDFEAVKDAGAQESDAPDAVDVNDGTDAADGSDAPSPTEEQDSLLDVLRSRRGQRLGADEEQDDALAVMLTRGTIPAAHPRDGGESEPGQAGEDPLLPGLTLAPQASADAAAQEEGESSQDRNDDGTPRLYDGVSTDTREISIFARPSTGRAPRDRTGAAADEPARPAANAGRAKDSPKDTAKDDVDPAAERRAKPKRSSVPSWDDIVFGRRGD